MLKWKINFHSVPLLLKSCIYSFKVGAFHCLFGLIVAFIVTINTVMSVFRSKIPVFWVLPSRWNTGTFLECGTEFHFNKRSIQLKSGTCPRSWRFWLLLFQKIRFKDNLIFFNRSESVLHQLFEEVRKNELKEFKRGFPSPTFDRWRIRWRFLCKL